MFTIDQIRATIGRDAKPRQVYLDALIEHGDILRRYGVTTPAHAAMILGQVCHETGDLTILTENMNYRAERISQVWPSRPEAVKYAGDPHGLANSVYGSRMGNRPGTMDGYNFRGTGLAQHTGRDGFAAISKISGIDFLSRPELLITDPPSAAHALGAFWRWKRLGEVCPDTSEASIIAVTKRWNGGQIGLADRIVKVRRAAKAMGQTLPPIRTTPPLSTVSREATGAAGVAAGGAAVTTSSHDQAAGLALVAVMALAAIGGVMIYRINKTRKALKEAARIEDEQAATNE